MPSVLVILPIHFDRNKVVIEYTYNTYKTKVILPFAIMISNILLLSLG